MLTVLVPTYNCEDTIRACLESVKWADRIFIVDSFSTDHTLDICREYTDWIVQHEYINSAKQKNWAMEQIASSSEPDEWTLEIDSDEELEPALVDEIRRRLTLPHQPDAYQIKIKNFVWGEWVKCCGRYPCAQIRLFRTDLGRWSEREVHARIQGITTTAELENHILHADITDLSAELQQFSRQVVIWESNELIKKGRRWRWIDVTLRPLAIFLLLYFRTGGYREGFRGFYLSVYRSFYSFMTYARLYEYEVYQGKR